MLSDHMAAGPGQAGPGQAIPGAGWAEAIFRLQSAGLGSVSTDAASDASHTRT